MRILSFLSVFLLSSVALAAPCQTYALTKRTRCYSISVQSLSCGALVLGNTGADLARVSRGCSRLKLERSYRILATGRGWVSVMENFTKAVGMGQETERVTVGTYSTRTGKRLSVRDLLGKRGRRVLARAKKKFQANQHSRDYQWKPLAFSYRKAVGTRKEGLNWTLPHLPGPKGGMVLTIGVDVALPRKSSARVVTAAELAALKRGSYAKSGYVDPKQTLALTLPRLGQVFLVPVQKGNKAHLFLVRGTSVLQKLPPHGCNNWYHAGFRAIALRDVDQDGNGDLLAMGTCMSGAGPGGARGFPTTTVYYLRGNRFVTIPQHQSIYNPKLKTIAKMTRFLRRFWGAPGRELKQKGRTLRGRVARVVNAREYVRLQRAMHRRGSVIPRRHTLWLRTKQWGVVYLVPFVETRSGSNRAYFALVKNGKSLVWLPSFYGNLYFVRKIIAISFADVDRDGRRDVVVMALCRNVSEGTGGRLFRLTTVFFQRRNYFTNFQRVDGFLTERQPRTLRKAIRIARSLFRRR